MGALRAAELATFGMVGVGWIFEQFDGGVLTDDDEVAIVHASAEDDYRPGSEAMVNIRRTLDAAQSDGIVGAADAVELTARAKAKFYPDRCWPQVIADAADVCGPPVATALKEWLRTGRVDQKRRDALELLELLGNSSPEPVSVSWRFNHTVYWNELIGSSILDVRSAPVEPDARDHGVEVSAEAILDELRLDHGAFTSAYRSAMIRAMAKLLAASLGLHPDDQTVASVAQRHFAAQGIGSAQDLQAWQVANHLSPHDTDRIAAAEARFEQVTLRLSALTMETLVDYLRWNGQSAGLIARARRKQDMLCAFGIETPTFEDAQTDAASVYTRWFEANGVPEPADVDAWARESGYGDIHRFRRMLLREETIRRMETR